MHFTCSINSVGSDDLASPVIVVISYDADASGKKHDFTSAVDATEFAAGGLTISEVIELKLLLDLALTGLRIVGFDLNIVGVESVVSRWCQVDLIASHPVESLINDDHLLFLESLGSESASATTLSSVHLDGSDVRDGLVTGLNSSIVDLGVRFLLTE